MAQVQFFCKLFIKIEKVIKKEMPNAILVLGDTNSAINNNWKKI